MTVPAACLTVLFHVFSQLIHRERAQKRRAVCHVQAFGQRELPCARFFQVAHRHARRDAARIQIDCCRRARYNAKRQVVSAFQPTHDTFLAVPGTQLVTKARQVAAVQTEYDYGSVSVCFC